MLKFCPPPKNPKNPNFPNIAEYFLFRMLKKVSSLKIYSQQAHCRYFASRPRLEKKIFAPYYRDYTKAVNNETELPIAKIRTEHSYDLGNIKPLSKAETSKSKVKVWVSDKDSFNKAYKKVSNWRVERTGVKLMEAEANSVEAQLMGKSASDMNKVRIAEWEKFKKKFFKKTEIQRLLAKEELNSDHAHKNNDYGRQNEYLTELFGNIEKWHSQDFVSGNSRPAEVKQMRDYDLYIQSMKNLKNMKANSVLQGGKSNEKLRQLLDAGF